MAQLTPTNPGKFIFQNILVNVNQVTFQDSSRTQFGIQTQFFFANGRGPQYFGKWKMTSITTSIFWEMKDDLNNELSILENERQPQYFGKRDFFKTGR